ncbi:hypothetical protein [Microcoleus vaginatus]|uniref:hypothetical protein n=1 Tax=Microcoleus vaginatus TaxID=119532 RepID=UPI00403F7ED6
MELTTEMVSAQLSLFDTAAAEVGSLYKAGDWVMLRRKPAIAAWVKRGEVYKVNRVHPIDGSLQFWNPHTSDWDFLYPDEVKLAPAPPAVEDAPPPPAVDSPTPAEVAVGESILPTCETDVQIDFNAVGESILPTPAVDSPTLAEVAIGESNPPVDEECWESDTAVSTYKARGTARAGEAKYYRLSYKGRGEGKASAYSRWQHRFPDRPGERCRSAIATSSRNSPRRNCRYAQNYPTR